MFYLRELSIVLFCLSFNPVAFDVKSYCTMSMPLCMPKALLMHFYEAWIYLFFHVHVSSYALLKKNAFIIVTCYKAQAWRLEMPG